MAYKRKKIETEKELETIRISPSSLNSFNGCPKRWYYNYILQLDTKDTIHLVRGNIVHSVLENLFKQRFVPAGEAFRPHMEKYANKLLKKEWKEEIKRLEITKESEELFYEETELMINKFVRRFCDDIAEGVKFGKYTNETQGYYFTRPTFKELWIDDQFKINFNEKWKKDKDQEKIPLENTLNVGGFIDAVQKNGFDKDSGVVLIDYKTSSLYKQAMSEEYYTQLAIYAYLWHAQTGNMPEFVCINYLKYDKSFYIMVTPSIIEEAKRKIKRMRADIIEFGFDGSKYYTKPGKLCDWCDFKERCGKDEIDAKNKTD